MAGEDEEPKEAAQEEEGVIRLEGLTEQLTAKMFPYGAEMIALVGSKSHGTWMPKTDPESIDDIDLMGVFIGPTEAYFGFGRQETIERKFGEFGAYDCVSYEMRHFFSLLLKANPNVLGMLWMPEKHILYKTETADWMRANRGMFATKAAYHSFIGYANGQLHRMTHFDGPARQKMMEIELELTRRHIPLNWTPEELAERHPENHALSGTLKGGEEEAARPYFRLTGKALLTTYRELCNKYTSGYMGQKRRELVEKHGYDTKNATHLIRLLRMGAEFLREGELHVDRTGRDAEELKSIKRGEWTLGRVKDLAEELFADAKRALEESTLPERPNRDDVEMLLTALIAKKVIGYSRKLDEKKILTAT